MLAFFWLQSITSSIFPTTRFIFYSTGILSSKMKEIFQTLDVCILKNQFLTQAFSQQLEF